MFHQIQQQKLNFLNHLFLKIHQLNRLRLGNVKVTLDETVPGAFKPTYSPPVVSPKS
jgi:hypothetical protein